MLKNFKSAIMATVLACLSFSALAADFFTFNNGLNKININEVAYVKKADSQDAAIFYMTNGTSTAAIPGAYQSIQSDSRFVNDGNYYIDGTNSAKAINTKRIVKADRGPGYQGDSRVTYTMVGGYVIVLDLGSESFLGSYWSNLY